jgi:hypothetical protein
MYERKIVRKTVFFIENTTAQEQCAGVVDYDVLMSRFAASKAEFLKNSPFGRSVVEAHLLFNNTVYELLVDMYPDEGMDGVLWFVGGVDGWEIGGGEAEYLNAPTVPLTWESLVPHLCARFNLDPEAVWRDGVNLRAYWNANDEEGLKVPQTEEGAPYTLARLYRSQSN